MIPPIAPALSMPMFAVTLCLLLVAPLALAGVALINTGLGRSRSAAQSLLGSLMIVAVTAIVFAVVGAAFTGVAGALGHSFDISGKPFDWLGSGRLLLGGLDSAGPEAQLTLLFEFLAVALCALIPWGSGADAPPPPCSPPSSFRSQRTGSGAADGWPSWG